MLKCQSVHTLGSSYLTSAYWSAWKQFWIPKTPEKKSPQLPSGSHSRVYQPLLWGSMFSVSEPNPCDCTLGPHPLILVSLGWKTAGFHRCKIRLCLEIYLTPSSGQTISINFSFSSIKSLSKCSTFPFKLFITGYSPLWRTGRTKLYNIRVKET